MSDEKHTPGSGKPSPRELREQRLAEALRANLRKRKAQMRDRRKAGAAQTSGGPERDGG